MIEPGGVCRVTHLSIATGVQASDRPNTVDNAISTLGNNLLAINRPLLLLGDYAGSAVFEKCATS
jgi:hypothetical protein